MEFTFAIVVALLLLISILIKLVRQFTLPRAAPVSAEWVEEISIERYRAMARLLNPEDLAFLRSNGATSRMESAFRAKRCRLFREYLQNLNGDFRRICQALELLIVQSHLDRPDLSSTLLRSRLIFAYRMTVVQMQLSLYRYGIGTVSVDQLMSVFNGMRLELSTLFPANALIEA